MKKKLLALISCLSFMLFALPVHAAPAGLPLSIGNSWSVSTDGGGEFEYTIPYTGNYEISLSGSQGSAYSNSSGGYGYTLKKTIRLQYGDVIKYNAPTKPTGYTTTGANIMTPKGNDATLSVNGTQVWIAGAGAGYITNNIAPDSITNVGVQTGTGAAGFPVHWHSGNGKSGASHSNSFPTVYSMTNPGGCYGGAGHTHDACFPCSWQYTYHEHTSSCSYTEIDTVECTGRSNGMSYFRCTACGAEYSHYDGGASSGWGWGYCTCPASREYHCSNTPNAGHQWTCGSPTNTWTIQCGYSQGQIVGYNNASFVNNSCYFASGWQPDSQSVTNAGHAKFSIRLVEQSTLYYLNTKANPYWKNVKCNLVLRDNTVAYFKRP